MPTINRPKPRPRVRYARFQEEFQHYYNSSSWHKLRNWYISQHPLCECCERHDVIRPAEHVHHKMIWSRASDEMGKWRLLLDPTNLMSLCGECHRKMHERATAYNLNYIEDI